MNGARFILIAALASPALAAPGDDAVRAGNELYRSGAYEDALAQYERVDNADALTLFNRACALQRLGRSQEAQELLQTVDAMTRRDDLAASARYNLGGASVAQARTLAAEGQAAEALDAYKRAARLYRDAYAIDPSDRDAARNVEVAGREAKALLDQIRAQQQAMQEMAEQLQDLQEQQEQESQENQSSPSQEPGEGDENEQQQQQDAAQRQESISQQTQQARDQLRDMQQQMQQSQQGSTAAAAQQDPLERAAQCVEDAMQDQQRAKDQLERGDQESAAESQRAAAEDLQQALREMSEERSPGDESSRDRDENDSESESAETDQDAQSENEQQSEQEQPEDSSSDEQQQGQGQSQQSSPSDGGSGEAGDEPTDPLDAIAEELLEKEKDDRERLQRIRAQRRAANAPVEKDW